MCRRGAATDAPHDGLGRVVVVDGQGEGSGGQGEQRCSAEGQLVCPDVGRGRSRRGWAEPTPMSTVERTATPAALPTWRMVLKKVEARPIDSG